MRYLLKIILFILPIPLSATQYYNLKGHISQDSTMSHNQFYIVPDYYCYTNDYVGVWRINATDTLIKPHDWDNYSFSIVGGNTGTAFKIVGDTMLAINDSADIVYGSDFALIIRTTYGTYTENDTAFIHITHKDSTIFIDPASSGTQTGTRTQPFDNWVNDIEPDWGDYRTSGYTFLWKRGGTADAGDNMYVTHYPVGTTFGNNSGNWMYIGSYGTGSRPLFNGNGTDVDNGLLFGSGTNCGAGIYDSTRNVIVTDIDIVNFAGTNDGIRATSGCYNLEFHRIYLRNNGIVTNTNGNLWLDNYCGADIIGSYNLIQDVFSDYHLLSHNIKVEIYNAFIISSKGYNSAAGNNLSIESTPYKTVYHFIGNNADARNIVTRARHTTIKYSYLTDSYSNIYAYDDGTMGPDTLMIEGNYFTQSDADGGILIEDCDSGIIRRNIIADAPVDDGIYVYRDNTKLYITQNDISNAASDGISFNNASNTYVTIANNIIYNSPIGINFGTYGAGNRVLNNTVVKNTTDISESGSTNIVLDNNLYQTISGANWVTNDSNVVYAVGMVTNFSTNDFSVLDSNSALVDMGKAGVTTTDYLGLAISGERRDVGAYEYQFPATEEEDTSKLTVNPLDDGMIRGGSNSSTNYNAYTYMIIKTKDISEEDDTYNSIDFLKFYIGALDSTVDTAYVKMFMFDYGVATLSVYNCDSNWTEETLTWDNAPAKDSLLDQTNISALGDDSYITWDVTYFINAAHNANQDTVSFRFESNTTDYTRFYAKENLTNMPELWMSKGMEPTQPVVSTTTRIRLSGTRIPGYKIYRIQ